MMYWIFGGVGLVVLAVKNSLKVHGVPILISIKQKTLILEDMNSKSTTKIATPKNRKH